MDISEKSSPSFCQKCITISTKMTNSETLTNDNNVCEFEPNTEKIYKCIKCTHHIVHHSINRNLKRQYQIFFDPSKIVENLYVGSIQTSLDFNNLNENKIEHIINCVEETTKKWLNYKKFNNINYLNLNIDDDKKGDILPHFRTIFPYIDRCIQKNENILVHCVRGMSRSIAIVVGYLMYKFDITYEESFKIVKNKRNISKPNKNLQNQLLVNSNIIRQLKFF